VADQVSLFMVVNAGLLAIRKFLLVEIVAKAALFVT